jgi:hypothetical protein
VQGSPLVSGLWILRQDGETVISTDESYYRAKGKAAGDKLEGDVYRSQGKDFTFNFVLSSDGKSFDGLIKETTGTKRISGIKVE